MDGSGGFMLIEAVQWNSDTGVGGGILWHAPQYHGSARLTLAFTPYTKIIEGGTRHDDGDMVMYEMSLS